MRVCEESRSYSFTTMVSSSMQSATQREAQAMSMGVSPLTARARAATASRCVAASASHFLRRGDHRRASIRGRSACASAARVSRGAPARAPSVGNPRTG